METVLQFWAWLSANILEIGALVSALIAVAEAIVRLTPTKVDDGAVERIGKAIRSLFDMLKIPNNVKKPPVEEEKKP
jgi:acetolactate synthase small subunit